MAASFRECFILRASEDSDSMCVYLRLSRKKKNAPNLNFPVQRRFNRVWVFYSVEFSELFWKLMFRTLPCSRIFDSQCNQRVNGVGNLGSSRIFKMIVLPHFYTYVGELNALPYRLHNTRNVLCISLQHWMHSEHCRSFASRVLAHIENKIPSPLTFLTPLSPAIV